MPNASVEAVGETRSEAPQGAALPLIVDVDGVLIRTDLLVEAIFAYLGRKPLELPRVLFWLVKGKARLKAELAVRCDIDPATLPYDPTVLARIEAARGVRPVYLASASNERYIAAIAGHLGLFDGWFASDAVANLSGSRKAERLVAAFGEGGFDYIGDSMADLAVWRRASHAIAIGAAAPVRAALHQIHPDAEFVEPGGAKSGFRAYVKLLRPHQWAKNALVFVPLLTAHAFNIADIGRACLAFAAFSLCASSVYIMNDLVDVEADRGHPSKRKRPFASGAVQPQNGVFLAPLLVAAAFLIATLLPSAFVAVLAVYLVATSAYSFFLKRKMMIDVVTLAGLYAVRVISGGAAIGVPISEWLLAFAMFIFLALALIKRHSEMAVRLDAGLPDPANRDYRGADLPVLLALAASAGYAAVIVFALYAASPAVHALYRHPRWLYLVCPLLLYWFSRVLMLSHRRNMNDDPVVFALKDRVSLATAALVGLVALAAA
jgi:4-hydroxybenzoate polyprenyltransferase